jgi:large subunit ribosomal protein L23
MPRIHFPNFPLRLMLPTDRVAAAADGVKELVFRTLPSVNKARVAPLRLAQRARGAKSVLHPLAEGALTEYVLTRTRAVLAWLYPQVEIRTLLQRLYGFDVTRVDTVNYEGKKKRSRAGFFRKPDYKVAYVTMRQAVKFPAPPPPPAADKAKAKA